MKPTMSGSMTIPSSDLQKNSAAPINEKETFSSIYSPQELSISNDTTETFKEKEKMVLIEIKEEAVEPPSQELVKKETTNSKKSRNESKRNLI